MPLARRGGFLTEPVSLSLLRVSLVGVTPLVDGFGRVHTDLRVSLTDKCNLRCTYCMPPEGLEWLPPPEGLTDDELVLLVGLALRELGITEVRLTGGEPLLRRSLVSLVARLAALEPRPQL